MDAGCDLQCLGRRGLIGLNRFGAEIADWLGDGFSLQPGGLNEKVG